MMPMAATFTLTNGGSVSVAAAVLCASAFCMTARAQPYPVRAVRLVVASSPGSGVDIVSRIVAQRMSESLGAQMVVDNRPGAGGALGVQQVARAAADGYTLLMAAPSFTIAPSVVRDLPYDTLRDFAPVGQATTGAKSRVPLRAVLPRVIRSACRH